MRLIFCFIVLINFTLISQDIKIAVLQYSGGGDWYANPTSLKNLIRFCNINLGLQIDPSPRTVSPSDNALFQYPFIHLTGHGNIVFNSTEAERVREYLISGGFLHIDDNYGLDPYVRLAMRSVFPELEFIELPVDHLIFQKPFQFPNGLPKVHEHDNKKPTAFGLFWEGRLVCVYTYESDLGDGWEDPEVHNDSEEVRLQALKMGANLINYAFTGGKEVK